MKGSYEKIPEESTVRQQKFAILENSEGFTKWGKERLKNTTLQTEV